MEERTKKELNAWAFQIMLKHDGNQPEQVRALYEEITNMPVSALVKLVGEQPIKGLLYSYVAGSVRTPMFPGEE